MQAETLTDSSGNQFEMRPWHCPICLESETKFLGYRGGKYHRYKVGVATRIVRCKSCGLLFSDPFPIPLNAQELYKDPDEYFWRHNEEAKIEKGVSLLRDLQSRSPNATQKSMRILDVGSGRGELLVAAKRLGWDAVGLDFSKAMIDYAKEKHGVTVLNRSIEEYSTENPKSFDGVFLSAILEHVYDPSTMIQSASRHLKPGGLVYIDVPNEPHLIARVGNLVNRMMGKLGVFNLSPTWPPYHIYGFNPPSLKRLLEKYDLKIESLEIFSNPWVPSSKSLLDRFRTSVALPIGIIANLTRQASNMYVWARLVPTRSSRDG